MNNLKKIKIQLNGKKYQIKMGYNLKDLLKILKKDNNKVAIELNGEIADKKIIRKLIEVLEDLKKSLKDNEIINSDDPIKEKIDDSKAVIKSPLVGTAYLSPNPGAKPFVSVGKKIKKGDTVMIVEAMKTMNHVPSPINGTIKKICIEDGQPVEFGQVLVLLD